MNGTDRPSQSWNRGWRTLRATLLLSLPLGLLGCASQPLVCPLPKPMPEALQKVQPRDDLKEMCRILGENCSSSGPSF
jgi:hypothetical protein